MGSWEKLGRRERRLLTGAGIGLIISGIFSILTLASPLISWQWLLSDRLFRPSTPSSSLVLAAIDDATLARYGKWSEWPRSLHAQAIGNLKAAGVRVVGMDILFADTSIEDPVLATALAEAGNVVLALAGQEGLPTPQKGTLLYRNLLLPTAPLQRAASALGHGNMWPDGDGVVRRMPLVIGDQEGKSYPALILVLLHRFFDKPLPQTYAPEQGMLPILGRAVPVDGLLRFRMNYVGGPGTIARVSYGDVVRGTFDPAGVRHKIVLVGMMSTAEPDMWVTPVASDKMFGVEIHAQALDTLLRARFLREMDKGTTLLVVFLLGALAALTLPFLKLRWGGALVAASLGMYLLAAFFAFDRGYLMNLIYPLAVIPLVYMTSLLYRILAEEAERQEVYRLFGRYVSPQVANEIVVLADAGRLTLGGERREMTVLFTDIRGYTQLSERLPPEEIVALLNKTLGVIIDRVFAHGGMVNKFAGDNIMAVWNAPQPQEHHPLLAVRAAVESQEALRALYAEEPNLPRASYGFGINTGEAIAGNMGSEGRSEYTVIGDSVNLASRICGACEGDEVWIGPETYQRVSDQIEAEALPPQYFKGKAEPVVVYRVFRCLEQGKTATPSPATQVVTALQAGGSDHIPTGRTAS